MSDIGLVNLLLLPIGLGLLGFIEPCSMGSNLIFVKYLEGRRGAGKIAQLAVFALTRALFFGALGVLAALLGRVFIAYQQGAWIVLGSVYIGIGAIYLSGRAGLLMRALGPRLSRFSGTRGSAGLGILFGFNVPACAAPLLFVLFGTTALGSGSPERGFLALALFGLALSAPLAVAVLWPPGHRVLDRIAALSRRVPRWTGAVLVFLGLWAIYFGLFVRLEDWA